MNTYKLKIESLVNCTELGCRMRKMVFGSPVQYPRDHEIEYDESYGRVDLINRLISINGYKKYLEIGVCDTTKCFDLVAAEVKHGVDPNPDAAATYVCTSDKFFESAQTDYDLIFIDGLHHHGQVVKDVQNALSVLREGGTIVCHDLNPAKEQHQVVPQRPDGGVWNGDCWRAWLKLRAEREDLFMFVVNADQGLGVIRRGKQQKLKLPKNLCWSLFTNHRTEFLNLVPTNDWESMYTNSAGETGNTLT